VLKTKEIVIETAGRDQGKAFVLTELPAMQAEKWAARAFNGLARANVEIPDTVVGAGLVGVWVMGIKMLFAMDFAICSELMDEMLSCVQFRPDPANPAVLRPIIGKGSAQGDVEEVTTLKELREEVFKLHVGFSLAEIIQKLTSALNPQTSSNTETSPGSLAQ
jgi:hypothetical protein